VRKVMDGAHLNISCNNKPPFSIESQRLNSSSSHRQPFHSLTLSIKREMDSRAVATCLARTSSRGCHRMTSSSSFSIRSASCVSLLSSSSSAAPCEANDSPSFSSSPCVTPSSRHDELRKATFQSLKQQQQQQQQRMTYSSVSSSSSSSSLQDKVASTTSKWSKEMTRNFSSSFSASPPPPPPGIGGNVNVDKNSASNGSSSKPKKTKVLLKETPRAKKQKLLLNGHSPSPLMNVTSSSSSSSSSSLFLNADQSLSLNGEHSHPALHLIKGGTPCDPAPPPYRLAEYGEESLYTLVLLRHGESEWNAQNRYTGWCDVNLTKKGEMEARTAGRLLYENGIEIDHAFTSVLKRASFSCNMALNMAKQHWVPITKSWRLNERHYGALQGFNKDTAWQELGLDQELVMQMRRSYDVRPPRMEDTHEFWHGNDRRYAKLSPEQLERTRAESLKDTAERIMPFINTVVTPSMRAGNKCLIVAHANTIRTLIKQIDSISDEDIKGMTIPTGIPLLYRLDKNFKPVDPQVELEFRYMVEPKG